MVCLNPPHLFDQRASVQRRLISLACMAMLQIAACEPIDGTAEESEIGRDDAGGLTSKVLPFGSYEAERRTAENGCQEASGAPGYTGSGFMDFGGPGTWIEWGSVSAPQNGRYVLSMRYANGGASNRSAAIIVNGHMVGTMPFAVTGGWTQWKTASIEVALSAGVNTVRVSATASSGGPNLDRMDVASSDVEPPPPPPPATLLDRPSDTRLRIGSWNVFRGSVFPRTDDIWSAINRSAKYQVGRSDAGARVFRSMDADIWLLQETAYSSTGLPAGITVDDINDRIAEHMRGITGKAWNVRCNGWGLCTMIRSGLRFEDNFNPHFRVAGNRIVLPDGSKVLVVNVHYMDLGHAQKTASLIESAGSGDAAVFVGGDFNDVTGGARFNTVDAVSGMEPLTIFHARDPKATHLAGAVASAPPFKNTGGQVAFGDGPSGQDVVTSVSGGTIDHFFLRSATWQAEHRFILNSFLLSPDTLASERLTSLDVALVPQDYQSYFRDFLTMGVVYELPSGMRGIAHDHLPMIVDFTW